MEHWILRCKHCQREYTYCTYGNGPGYGTEEGCSQEYCSECQKAIDEALNRIPVKFKPIQVEIKDESLLNELEKIKNGYPKDNIVSVRIFFNEKFDVIEEYVYKGRKYYVKYNDDTPNDKHIFIEKEFDIIKNETTEKYWRHKGSDKYSLGRKYKMPKFDFTRTNNIEPPLGELFYFSPEVINNK